MSLRHTVSLPPSQAENSEGERRHLGHRGCSARGTLWPLDIRAEIYRQGGTIGPQEQWCNYRPQPPWANLLSYNMWCCRWVHFFESHKSPRMPPSSVVLNRLLVRVQVLMNHHLLTIWPVIKTSEVSINLRINSTQSHSMPPGAELCPSIMEALRASAHWSDLFWIGELCPAS